MMTPHHNGYFIGQTERTFQEFQRRYSFQNPKISRPSRPEHFERTLRDEDRHFTYIMSDRMKG